MKLRKLQTEHIEGFYRDQLDAGYSASTVRHIHSVLHRGLERALRLGVIPFNPATGANQPRKELKEMKTLDEYQVQQFLIAAHESHNEALFTPCSKDWHAPG